MNPNHSRGQSSSVSIHADPMSPGASTVPATVLFDEYLKEEELDVSDDISDDSGHDGLSSKHAPLREQDRFLPIANIAKIMKRAIPDNGKIAKDSRECIQECVSEFISFITSEASDRCHQEKRKTINGDDILFAMLALGFDHYSEPLTLYLHKYRETTKSDRNLLGTSGTTADTGGKASAAATSSNTANTGNSTTSSAVGFDHNVGSGTTRDLIAASGSRGQRQQQQHHSSADDGTSTTTILFYPADQNPFPL